MKFYNYNDDIVFIENEDQEYEELLVKSVIRDMCYITTRDKLQEFILDRYPYDQLVNVMILNNYDHLYAVDNKCTPYLSQLCKRIKIKGKEYILLREECGCQENYEYFLYDIEHMEVYIRSTKRAKELYQSALSCSMIEDFERLEIGIDEEYDRGILTIVDRNNLQKIVYEHKCKLED